MKILQNIFFGLLAFLVLASVIGLIAIKPISKVERSVVMQAPVDVVFDQVNDLKKNQDWSPWKDPTLVITWGPVTAGKGATYSWVSKKMGNGTMTIAETVPSQSIDIDLDFGSMGKAKALWTFTSEGNDVKVTETMTSDAGLNPAKRWMSLMSDKFVGPMFEKGLASLKQISETRAAEIKVEQAAQQAAAAPAEESAVPADAVTSPKP